MPARSTTSRPRRRRSAGALSWSTSVTMSGRSSKRWSLRNARSSTATAGSSMRSQAKSSLPGHAFRLGNVTGQTAWIESLTPWPEEFGLDRMRMLLAELGEPQRDYPSIHVVGTNGKSTAVRTIEELLAGEGLTVGAYLSPHVRGWSERIRVG